MRWSGPFVRLRVTGTSMLPALRPGDRLLARRGGRVLPGRLVVVGLPDRPLAVKRATLRDADGAWWVSSDNPGAGAVDSWVLGAPVPAHDVVAVVLLRCPRGPARIRR